MLTAAQIKDFKFLLWLTVGWWLTCLLFSNGSILHISYTDCTDNICNITEKSWFGFGTEKDAVSFTKDAKSALNIHETSGRLPHYEFYLSKDAVTSCHNCKLANYVSLPIQFYWKNSADRYYQRLTAAQDLHTLKFNLSFLYFLNVWMTALLLSGIIIWRKR